MNTSDPGVINLPQHLVPVDSPREEMSKSAVLDELNVRLPANLVVDHVAEGERFAVQTEGGENRPRVIKWVTGKEEGESSVII